MSVRIRTTWLMAPSLALAALGCGPMEEQGQQAEMQTARETVAMEAPSRAVAVLHPTEGSDARGTVTFIRTQNGIRISADVEGLSPGQHGFHIHEFGDCTAPDGTSAGGHFNPEGNPHGAPSDTERHVGDLGNLSADESGMGHYERTDSHITFEGPHSIIGRGVIVHANEDDLTTQPTGNAGPRMACGVVGVAQEE